MGKNIKLFNTEFEYCVFSKSEEYQAPNVSYVQESNNVYYDIFNNHEYVDLNLQSGTLWATMNIGASSPEEIGSYFAYGETKEKETYTKETYKWWDGENYTKYSQDDNLEIEDDAAHTNWGGLWVVPTKEQFTELIQNTTSANTEINGVSGISFTSTNGNSIFLPHCGFKAINGETMEPYLSDANKTISMTSTLGSWGYIPWHFNEWNTGCGVENWVYRASGMTVRPVLNRNYLCDNSELSEPIIDQQTY